MLLRACATALCVVVVAMPAIAQAPDTRTRVQQHEKIEWTWSDRPEQPDPRLPNVLLEGDSITRNYYDAVSARLRGTANVYLFATSLGVGDPRLGDQLRSYLKGTPVRFTVIHLNNGMHGANYSADDYARYYPELLAPLRGLSPAPRCVVATTTPVRKAIADTPTNAAIDQRNAVATGYARQFGCTIDDQHGLMLPHADLYADDVHFGPAGAALQGEQVARTINAQLQGLAK